MIKALAFGIAIFVELSLGNYAVAMDSCGLSAVVQAGGGREGTKFETRTNVSPFGNVPLPIVTLFSNRWGTPGPLGFADGVLSYGCENWQAQVDGAFYNHVATLDAFGLSALGFSSQTELDNPQSHIGGAIALRDPGLGKMGLAGSHISSATSVEILGAGGGNVLTYNTSYSRIGGFAELYAGDFLTFGASAFHVTGSSDLTVFLLGTRPIATHDGMEGTIYAKFYPHPNVSISARGDVQREDIVISPAAVGAPLTGPLDGYALTAQVEYLLPNTPLSLALGARYGFRELGPLTLGGPGGVTADSRMSATDEQVFATLRFDIGAKTPKSLVTRDRDAPYDNTSVMKEKLPSYFGDLLNSALTP